MAAGFNTDTFAEWCLLLEVLSSPSASLADCFFPSSIDTRLSVEMVEYSVHSLAISVLRQLPASHEPVMDAPASANCVAADRLNDLAVNFLTLSSFKRVAKTAANLLIFPLPMFCARVLL